MAAETSQVTGGVTWVDRAGEPLTCHEKLKVLAENLSEVQALAQDAFEEALILNVDEGQIRTILQGLMTELENPYG